MRVTTYTPVSNDLIMFRRFGGFFSSSNIQTHGIQSENPVVLPIRLGFTLSALCLNRLFIANEIPSRDIRHARVREKNEFAFYFHISRVIIHLFRTKNVEISLRTSGATSLGFH